jgi:hypothetical protein
MGFYNARFMKVNQAFAEKAVGETTSTTSDVKVNSTRFKRSGGNTILKVHSAVEANVNKKYILGIR